MNCQSQGYWNELSNTTNGYQWVKWISFGKKNFQDHGNYYFVISTSYCFANSLPKFFEKRYLTNIRHRKGVTLISIFFKSWCVSALLIPDFDSQRFHVIFFSIQCIPGTESYKKRTSSNLLICPARVTEKSNECATTSTLDTVESM